MSGSPATIDGRRVVPAPAETLLAAARRVGVDVPTLCHRDGLPVEGGCRLCLVEVAGRQRPVAACHTAVEPGMVVTTDSPRLGALRRDLLRLMLEALPPGGLVAAGEGTELAALAARLGVRAPASRPRRPAGPTAPEHPYLRFREELCIVCRRCLHACEAVQGQFVYGIGGRGADRRLLVGPDGGFAASDCTACGACVDACPSGAVTDRDRLDPRPAERVTDTVCGYCGVGCRVRVESAGGRVVRIAPVPGAAVNRGHLCAKGRFAHGWQASPDRLTRPLLRRDGELEPVSWEEAIGWAARRLREIAATHGPGALGVMTSSRSTNEAGYLLQKLFRVVLGTNHVDCCARVCHSSTALALGLATGTGAASASLGDIERAGAIVVAGANPTEAHPVVGARIRQAVLDGARLLVVDPRRIEIAAIADLHLPLAPGSNVALFNALAKLLLAGGRVDRRYLEERVEGLADLEEHLAGVPLAAAAVATGLAEETIRAGAEWLGEAGPVLFVHGLGLSELTQGTASVLTLCNLGMLTGSIGRPGAGMLPLRGQNNVQGNADMGSMPDQVTGYQRVDDPAVRRRCEEVWGAAPPPEPGLTVTEMVEAAAEGRLRGLWIQGEDIAQSDPHQERVLEALARLDLLVVQELFPSPTARFAHLVLPAAGALENDGTFTNGERRIQRVRPAVAPPGEARPDWEVAVDLANALGAGWAYDSPAAVMDEIARLAPEKFGGVSYPRLDGDGLQWPCPTPGHPGTAVVHCDGFLRGRGRLTAVDWEPPPEARGDAFPWILVTGRVLHQYNVGTMTRRTPQRELAGADYLEVAPADARRLGLGDGDTARLTSRWGECRAPVRLSARVVPGTLFLSFHYPETATNRLVGPHRDPRSKCPDYKVVAVRVEAAAAGAAGVTPHPAARSARG